MNTIFIIAGEVSGDLQAAKLMRAMNHVKSDVRWIGIGGDRMIEAGLKPVYHIRDMAFMGFVEVIRNIRSIIRRLRVTKKSILDTKPDLVLLIDYPGFNLKIASFAHQHEFKTAYYITPQVWAWHQSRVKLMKRYLDEIINVFPFEVDFYEKHGIKSHYFGHPLTENLTTRYRSAIEFKSAYSIDPDNTVIGLLPGSRRDEVEKMMPVFREFMQLVRRERGNIEFCIGKVDHIEAELYQVAGLPGTHLISGCSYDIMNFSQIILVASGTATLETACFETPMIVCYKTSPVTFWIARKMIRIEYVSLVNIIAGQKIVPEVLQADLTATRLMAEFRHCESNSEQIRQQLASVHQALQLDNVSERVAHFLRQRFLS